MTKAGRVRVTHFTAGEYGTVTRFFPVRNWYFFLCFTIGVQCRLSMYRVRTYVRVQIRHVSTSLSPPLSPLLAATSVRAKTRYCRKHGVGGYVVQWGWKFCEESPSFAPFTCFRVYVREPTICLPIVESWTWTYETSLFEFRYVHMFLNIGEKY